MSYEITVSSGLYAMVKLLKKVWLTKSCSGSEKFFWGWESIKHGALHGPILRHLLFVINIDDLRPNINALSETIILPGGSSVMISDTVIDYIFSASNICIRGTLQTYEYMVHCQHMNTWYTANILKYSGNPPQLTPPFTILLIIL
jgi:hypothetical protein